MPPSPETDFPAEAARWQIVLRERAQRYARRTPASRRRERPATALVFVAGGHRFALPIELLAQVLEAPWIARVAGAPPEVAGVFSLRGELLCAVDLPRLVGLQPGAEAAQARYLVLLKARSKLVGLPADAIAGVVEYPPAALLPARAAETPGLPTRGLLPDATPLLDWPAICHLSLFQSL